MLIDKIGIVVGKKINQLGKVIGQRRLPFTSGTDTFVKSADTEIPAELRKILKLYRESNSKDPDAEENLIKLYKIGKEKFHIIYDSKAFDYYDFYFCDKEFLKAVKNLTGKEIETGIKEVQNLYSSLPKVNWGSGEVIQTASPMDMAKLLILKANNPETYNYLITNSDKKFVSNFMSKSQHLTGSVFESLTIPQIRQIMDCGTEFTRFADSGEMGFGLRALDRYISSSDHLRTDEKGVQALSNLLSHSKVSEAFTAFRGERDTGMFASVMLDKGLALKTKFYVLKNIFKSKRIMVHDYTGNYETSFDKKLNLFDYIMGKKELTLADAMQVAKFGNEKYKQEVIQLIKESQISDSRFKSLTFDRQMAQDWALQGSNGCENTKIIQNMTVKTGLEGMYSPATNMQAEFILNNNPKTINFQNVVYDETRDMFIIESTIKNK